MQIIAGEKRGAKLATVPGFDVRPTAQRTREALFNILEGGRFLSGLAGCQVLDLFAGSGALGLEALSRGASSASFVEKSSDAISIIKKNAHKIAMADKVHVIQSDCLTTRQWHYEKADLVFCDPPYDKGLAISAIENFRAIGAFSQDALIVIETRISTTLSLPDDLLLLETRRYGMAGLHFCRYR
ncbi:MAG: 16S rRNA (guanine(966)-N(2))-methyltransferase RsmD [Candidatus Puniceispirillaceae bacterium]